MRRRLRTSNLAAVKLVHPDEGAEELEACVRAYAHNLLVGTNLLAANPTRLERVVHSDLVIEITRSPEPKKQSPGLPAVEQLARNLRRYVAVRGRTTNEVPCGTALGANVAEFGRIVGLNSVEQAVVHFLCVVQASRELSEFVDLFGALTVQGVTAIVAAATGESPRAVSEALTRSWMPCGGAVGIDLQYPQDFTHKLHIKEGLLDQVMRPGLNCRRLAARYVPEAPQPTLTWGDFVHLDAEASTTRDLLRAALRRRQPGVNVLLYGHSGTGKTELARLLAADLGVPLFTASDSGGSGTSQDVAERLGSLVLGQRLVKQHGALLLFDELEDLFRDSPSPRSERRVPNMSKQWFNTLLETNPTPTIWIANEVVGVDVAFLRRFTYAMEFRALGATQRARVLERHLGEKSAVTPEEARAIAERFRASPARLGTAVGAARMLAGDERPTRASIERILGPTEKLLTGRDPCAERVFRPERYALAATNASTNLSTLVEQLAGWRPSDGPGLSLCLYGAPGTGKSEFARYLAWRMGRSVVYRRASDLQSMWVGETEARIAEAFREAGDNDTVLVLDEADSFLQDRRGATRSWEVTQVNELLQQIETFRGVVVCTTNRLEALDGAAMRRFVLKIGFRWLKPEQALALAETVLPRPLEEGERKEMLASLGRLRTLAPGDFAIVARQASALGETLDPAELLRRLGGECALKRSDGARVVGFAGACHLGEYILHG